MIPLYIPFVTFLFLYLPSLLGRSSVTDLFLKKNFVIGVSLLMYRDVSPISRFFLDIFIDASDLGRKNCENTSMMCHLDKTSCSRYNIAVLGRRGVCGVSGPKTYFGVDAGSAAARKRILG